MTIPEQLNWVFIPMAAGLGALHALEPGHGKTLMAVYLAGSRRKRDRDGNRRHDHAHVHRVHAGNPG